MNKEETLCLVESVFLLHEILDDFDKVALWLVTPNPNLGEYVPIDAFFKGRGHKILQFIKAAKEENIKTDGDGYGDG